MFSKDEVRILALLVMTLCLIGFTVSGASAKKDKKEANYPAERLTVGDSVPVVEFKDIDGEEGKSADYQDWVVVYSFADRKSNKPMMEWMEDAQINVVRDHPELKLAFLSIADVAAVPSAFRYIVRPILRQINSSATKKLWDLYEERGIDLDAVKVEFRMIPDWTGDHLKKFGIKNAKEYQVFITHRGKILSFFEPETPDKKADFYRTFRDLALSLKSGPGEQEGGEDPEGENTGAEEAPEGIGLSR